MNTDFAPKAKSLGTKLCYCCIVRSASLIYLFNRFLDYILHNVCM